MPSVLRTLGAIRILCPAYSCERGFPAISARGGQVFARRARRDGGGNPVEGGAKEREDDKQDEDARKAAGHGVAIDAPKKPYFCTHKDVS